MSVLEVSQILFNFVISFAVIVVTILVSVIAYDTIKFNKLIKKFLNDLNEESGELYEKINNFLESILKLSFISKFFNRKKRLK